MKYDRPTICISNTSTVQQIGSTCKTEEEDWEISMYLSSEYYTWTSVLWLVLYVICVVWLSIVTIRELLQLKNGGLKYFRSKENIIELVTLTCSWTYVILVLWSFGYEWENIFGAVAIFFAWIEMSLMIGRIPSIGIYTFMMFQVVLQVATHLPKTFFLLFCCITLNFAGSQVLPCLCSDTCGLLPSVPPPAYPGRGV